VRTSNAGQVLFAGIGDARAAALVASGLMETRFNSGWGIRTVARGGSPYNPMSYHNGSIWPHDNSLIALGFARYGFSRPVEQVFNGLFRAATYMDARRLPELYCGFQRQRGRGPTLYPVACSPQAWASATPFALLEACSGRVRPGPSPRFVCAIRACRHSWTEVSCAICGSIRRASICACAAIRTRSRSISCAQRQDPGFHSPADSAKRTGCPEACRYFPFALGTSAPVAA